MEDDWASRRSAPVPVEVVAGHSSFPLAILVLSATGGRLSRHPKGARMFDDQTPIEAGKGTAAGGLERWRWVAPTALIWHCCVGWPERACQRQERGSRDDTGRSDALERDDGEAGDSMDAEARRKFLTKAGQVAVTAPAVTLLLAGKSKAGFVSVPISGPPKGLH